MKNRKILLLVLSSLALVSCGGGTTSAGSSNAGSSATASESSSAGATSGTSEASSSTSSSSIADVTIAVTGEKAVVVGRTITIVAEVKNAADPSVTWESDHPETASVVAGVVTGVAKGSAKITATSVADPTKSASIDIVVSEPTIDLAALLPAANNYTVSVKDGETVNTFLASDTMLYFSKNKNGALVVGEKAYQFVFSAADSKYYYSDSTVIKNDDQSADIDVASFKSDFNFSNLIKFTDSLAFVGLTADKAGYNFTADFTTSDHFFIFLINGANPKEGLDLSSNPTFTLNVELGLDGALKGMSISGYTANPVSFAVSSIGTTVNEIDPIWSLDLGGEAGPDDGTNEGWLD